MIHFVNEDLLSSDCTIIAHQVNCKRVMGTGIALRIKRTFPNACTPYFEDRRCVTAKLGTCLIGSEPFWKDVAHLYGQLDYGRDKRYTNYDALQTALEELVCKLLATGEYFKLGLPSGIGCNNAGGEWDVVLRIIEYVSYKYNVDMFVYNYQGGK